MKYQIVSMTGYGQSSISSGKFTIAAEIRSVNSRYLEMKIKMPLGWGELEERIREEISSRLARGRVEVLLTAHYLQNDATLAIDWELLRSVQNAHEQVKTAVGLTEPLSFADLLAVEGVLKVEKPEEDMEEIWLIVQKAVVEALNQLALMRKNEGERLSVDIVARVNFIKDKVLELEGLAPLVVTEYRDKLTQRIADLGVNLTEDRLEQEVALIADRMSVTEELVRLKSHCEGFLQIMAEGNSVGRKLDFLLQEMNREINTTGSKSSCLAISRLVVEVKSELEKIREQIQNIE